MKRFMKVTFERRNLRTTLTTDSMYRVSEIISLHKIYYLLTDVSNYYEAGETSEELLLDLKLLVQGLKMRTTLLRLKYLINGMKKFYLTSCKN